MSHTYDRLVIAGLGLLGGSIALRAREAGLARHIVGVGRSDLSEAVAAGVVDECGNDLGAACAIADLVILCTPVETIRRQIGEVLDAVPEGAVVTDVGSTKKVLVAGAEDHPRGAQFVGSHPMVGGHRTGWQHARANLWDGGVVYVTTTDRTQPAAAGVIGEFWRALGARVVFIHPDRHDQLCALLSHGPHMTAVALVEQLARSGEDVELLRLLAGPGFRDTTRIAMGSPEVWSEICQHNRENVAATMDGLAAIATEIAQAVRAGDDKKFSHLLRHARDLRSKF